MTTELSMVLTDLKQLIDDWTAGLLTEEYDFLDKLRGLSNRLAFELKDRKELKTEEV